MCCASPLTQDVKPAPKWGAGWIGEASSGEDAQRVIKGCITSDAYFLACFAAFFSLRGVAGCFFASLVFCLILPMIVLLKYTD
jgi:hypothetical protein